MADPVRVFISYSSKDRPIVKRLMEDLKQAGVEVWFDHETLKPGTPNWTAAVRSGVEQATDVIYAASPDAADSKYVGHELAIARDEGKEDHILPFWVRGEKWSRCVPFGDYYRQYIDGRDATYASGLAKLLTTLGILTSAEKAAHDPSIHLGNYAQISPIHWFDSSDDKVHVNGEEVTLTHTESLLLEYLVRHKGLLCSSDEIARHVWDEDHLKYLEGFFAQRTRTASASYVPGHHDDSRKDDLDSVVQGLVSGLIAKITPSPSARQYIAFFRGHVSSFCKFVPDGFDVSQP